MKLFACRTEECPAAIPYDARTNKVRKIISASYPLDEKGEIIENKDPEIEEVYYECGVCGNEVDEVELKEVFNVDFIKLENSFLYGEFTNPLRREEPFDCRINIKTKEVQLEVEPKKVEAEFIKSCFEQEYKENVEAEVFDVTTDKLGVKTYEVIVTNPVNGGKETVFVRDDKIINDPEINSLEREKVLQSVRRSVY